MIESVENLIIEDLRHIRGRVDQIADKVSELKHRMSSLEAGMALVKRKVIHGDETHARQQVSLDRLRERVHRLELI